MESTDNIIISKTTNPDTPEMKKVKNIENRQFKIWPNALVWGMQAGFWMGAYLILLQVLGGAEIVALKFLKYIILLGVLGWALSKYRKINRTASFFQNGIYLGACTTLITAVTLVLVDFVVTIILPEYSFSKFNLEVNSPMDFFATSGAIFFEILVFGMIITFIFLQYLKRNSNMENK